MKNSLKTIVTKQNKQSFKQGMNNLKRNSLNFIFHTVLIIFTLFSLATIFTSCSEEYPIIENVPIIEVPTIKNDTTYSIYGRDVDNLNKWKSFIINQDSLICNLNKVNIVYSDPDLNIITSTLFVYNNQSKFIYNRIVCNINKIRVEYTEKYIKETRYLKLNKLFLYTDKGNYTISDFSHKYTLSK